MVKAIIFDCFGVIVGKGFNNTYKQAGGDPAKDKAFINNMLYRTNLGLITEAEFNRAIASHLGISLATWSQNLAKAELPDKELLDLIKKLRQSYKTAILSNSNKGVLRAKIGSDNLNQCFDEIVCSAEEGLVKPDPDIYILAADRLSVKPNECVFIDDHLAFVEAARDIGMQAIQYIDQANLVQELAKQLSH